MPEPGGLYEQRVRTLDRLQTALNAIDAVTEKKLEQKSNDNS